MARNINEVEADEAEQGALPERDALLDVLKDVNSLKGKGKKLLGDISARLTKAESQHNLDKRAFAVASGCTRMEPTRLHSFLRHFDAYREMIGLDEMAGADMFEGETKTAAPKKAPKAAKAPKGPKPGKGKRGRPKKPPAGESVSAADAAAQAWGLSDQTETAGAA